jgi:hypothetical protein
MKTKANLKRVTADEVKEFRTTLNAFTARLYEHVELSDMLGERTNGILNLLSQLNQVTL